MISAALAVLKTDEERNALSEIYTKNIKSFYSMPFQNYTTLTIQKMQFKRHFWQ